MAHIRITTSLLISLIVLCSWSAASDSLEDLPKKAIQRSQITLPGSHPFVLNAKVVESTNLSNPNYQADIEEYWLEPGKWRRGIKTSGFSETLVVNGDKTSDEVTGDYYPNWLHTLVDAMFDPGAVLKGVDLSRSSDNPMIAGSKVCRRFTSMAGIAPISNKVFSSFCFNDGLLDMVSKPGYTTIYKDYKKFAGKQVAYTINEDIESGTVLQATIQDLAELNAPDESLFAVHTHSAPIQTIRADESTLRRLALNTPDIVWPTQAGGKNTGTLSLYICIDRTGHVREIYELNSTNPGLSDVARDQVMRWQFKPASSQKVAVQVESVLTFGFHLTANK